MKSSHDLFGLAHIRTFPEWSAEMIHRSEINTSDRGSGCTRCSMIGSYSIMSARVGEGQQRLLEEDLAVLPLPVLLSGTAMVLPAEVGAAGFEVVW